MIFVFIIYEVIGKTYRKFFFALPDPFKNEPSFYTFEPVRPGHSVIFTRFRATPLFGRYFPNLFIFLGVARKIKRPVRKNFLLADILSLTLSLSCHFISNCGLRAGCLSRITVRGAKENDKEPVLGGCGRLRWNMCHSKAHEKLLLKHNSFSAEWPAPPQGVCSKNRLKSQIWEYLGSQWMKFNLANGFGN